MREYKFYFKEKLKMISVSMLALGIFFTGSTFAVEKNDDLDVRLSDEYLQWMELSNKEKKNSIMPNTYIADPSEDVLAKYEAKKTPRLVSSLLGKSRVSIDANVSATSTQSRYSLVDDMDIRVEHQGITSECWAFSLIKAMETNIAITTQSRELKNFSERHMDYSTSKTFLDGINPNGFNREVGAGGIPICGLAYLTNGQGAVLEEDMPFENNENKIKLSELGKRVDTIVNDYVMLPAINKSYQTDSSGNTVSVKYYKSSGEEYSEEDLNRARQMIKEHLVKYGAVTTMTAGNYAKFYNNSDVFSATTYNCNVSNIVRDHAITIVGWDDNYSKNNFAQGARPSTDGAYIVLNSYGTDSFDNGYLYVSYEDYFIENELYGICETSQINYDTLYQHDYFGGIYQIGSSANNVGYYATIFEKENSQKEYLNSVGITLADYAKVEIYVNPNGTEFDEEKLVKVASPSTVYSPGYHTINFEEVTLTGPKFAIVVKQTSDTGKFYFSIETRVAGTLYSDITSSKLSYYSLDGKNWRNVSSTKITGVDTENADVCIKAFTKASSSKPENPDKPDDPDEPTDPTDPDDPTKQEDIFKSDEYSIGEEYIIKIEPETTIEDFTKNITTNLNLTFKDGDSDISDNKQIIKTGIKLKLSNGKEYTLIVRGDVNCDGKLSLVDISKTLVHYNEAKGYELTGNSKQAADMNFDGKINLIDLSQMVAIYNSK